MKLKINIPASLDDITLRSYKKYFKLQNEIEDVRLLKAQMIHIFCGVSLQDVYNMKYNDTEEVVMMINKLFETKPKLVTNFKLNNIDYGFHPNLDDMSLGEYIDLDTYIGDWDNIERAMNVLYRPIITKYKNRYSIDKYKLETSDDILDMPMSAVTSSIFFLLNLGVDLSKAMRKYLEKGQEEDLIELLSSQPNGVGINQFMNSLEEMLQDLKISLN
jgi:hypothetical protein|tara:strand:+ start:962 stop:1612 length:651 start_codon:yes stop_codon:yes gene_type:complete